MRILDSSLVLSPSDLANFLSCRHRAGLDLAAARKVIEKPRYEDPYAAMLRQHGDEHERAYVETLRTGRSIVDAVTKTRKPDSTRLTLERCARERRSLSRRGWRRSDRRLRRRPDAGRAEEQPRRLVLQVQDTKLAKETKGGTILQLSAYSDVLARIGDDAGVVQVVTPLRQISRRRLRRLLPHGARDAAREVAKGTGGARGLCRPGGRVRSARGSRCEARRRKDDLSYIAGVGRSHRVELTAQGARSPRWPDAGAGDVQARRGSQET
jgi:uncharacterized protein